MAKNIEELDEKHKKEIADAFILDLPKDGTFHSKSERITEYCQRK